MKFLNHVDFSKAEIRNAAIQVLGTAPSSPVNGQVYFDSVGLQLLVWNGSAWVNKATDSALLDSQNGAYYLNRTNHTGTQALSTVTMSTSRLAGRTTAGSGTVQEITVNGGLTLASTTLSLSNMAANTLKGNNTGSAAAPADLTATQVKTLLSLNNVDNTSDANKPISTATQAALDAKLDDSQAGAFGLSVLATATSAAGTALFDTFTLSADGLVPAPISSTGRFLKDDGTWSTVDTATTFNDLGDIETYGAGDAGKAYIVNATENGLELGPVLGTAAASDTGDFTPASHAGSGGAAHANATTSVAGFMSSTDKTKLDGIAAGATANSTDAFLLSRTNHTGTQTAGTISDLASTVKAYRLDEFASPTSSLNLNGQKITGLATPTVSSDAATYQFVLDQVQASSTGIQVKDPVRVAAISDVDIATGGLLTIDGVTLDAGDRVLLVGQTDPVENGVYIAAVGAWSRSTQEDEPTELKGAFWLVQEGAARQKYQYIVNNATQPTVGTDPITIVQFGATTVYTASNGVQLVGSDFQARTQASGGIVAEAAGLRIDTAVVAQKFSQNIGNGSDTSFAITHNLNTQDVVVSVRDAATNESVFTNWTATDANTVTVTVIEAPSTDAYRVTVIG